MGEGTRVVWKGNYDERFGEGGGLGEERGKKGCRFWQHCKALVCEQDVGRGLTTAMSFLTQWGASELNGTSMMWITG